MFVSILEHGNLLTPFFGGEGCANEHDAALGCRVTLRHIMQDVTFHGVVNVFTASNFLL
jgi:hypothetical protein